MKFHLRDFFVLDSESDNDSRIFLDGDEINDHCKVVEERFYKNILVLAFSHPNNENNGCSGVTTVIFC